MFGVDAKLVFNHIPEVVKRAEKRAVEFTDQAAHRIADGGRARARRDTGEMAAAFEVVGIEMAREVINTSAHFIYNEFGTRKMSAQPMLTPAAKDEAQDLEKNAASAFKEVL